jgi:thiosulfate reductase cytochrome b subunit
VTTRRPILGALVAVAFVTLLAAPAARGQQAVNPIHPAFAPLDAAGKKVATAEALHVDTTCGACHDAKYIAGHSGHATPRTKATCLQCHVDGGKLDVRPATLDGEGRLRREAIRIGAPKARSCAACHGIVAGGANAAALSLPPDLDAAPKDGRTFSLTLGEGAVVSPQQMADSFLNLEGKAGLGAPWDVHAAKLVDCVACHFAGNDPARVDPKQPTLQYLTADPRRPSHAEFLVRPDHRLGRQACRSCHDPMKAHAFLPYRARHMAALSCATCHLSAPRAPVAEMIDATVATLSGTPAVRYRNVDRRPGETLNAATLRPFRPLLVERLEEDGARRLAPVNLVSRYRWVSGTDRVEVPFDEVARAFVQRGAWAPGVIEAFDADRDGRLDERELRLDSPEKTAFAAGRLRALGVAQPAVEGILETIPLAHGVSTRDRALRDCNACHAADSRLSGDFLVAGYLPGGGPPRPPDGSKVELAGVIGPTANGGLVLRRGTGSTPGGLHVLGHTRDGLSNTLGFLVFLATFAGVALHGALRLALRRRRGSHRAPAAGENKYVFGRYERLWHWTMALSGVVLIATGLAVHFAGSGAWLDLATAVSLHNVFAAVLLVNAFLALFYHLTTRAIRTFIPEPKGFLARALEHMAWQTRGIFYGGHHPANAPGQKLNPLQQITYLALLNVLFPLQIATGLFLWAIGHWPGVGSALGGLAVIAPVHNVGAWLFLTFFVLHVYLVTTGTTPAEHLEAMVTGYQRVDTDGAVERSQA